MRKAGCLILLVFLISFPGCSSVQEEGQATTTRSATTTSTTTTATSTSSSSTGSSVATSQTTTSTAVSTTTTTTTTTSTIAVKSGELTQDEIWSGEIFVSGTVFVPEGVTLTIEPGAVVKFQHYQGYRDPSQRAGLDVQGGILIATGTPSQQVWFTSYSTDPINGDWNGISLSNTTDSRFDYCIVEFGEMGIEQFDATVEVSNSTIRWSNAEGLYAERSRPTFQNNTLYQNGYHDIALEQYNTVQILNNKFLGGNYGVHHEKTTSNIEGNYFKDYAQIAITAGMESNIVINNNRFENIATDPPVSIDGGSTYEASGNDFGTGSVSIPAFAYDDVRNYELGYVPGDDTDRYTYIYDTEDETRRVLSKIGQGIGFGWALCYVDGYLYRFSLGSGELGDSLDFIQITPTPESRQLYANDVIMNPRGLTHDGEYFYVNDFSLLKIYKFTVEASAINIVDSFDIPEASEGGTSGLTTDGTYLYLRSRNGTKLYKLDKSGNLISEIELDDGIGTDLVWTGSYFWGNGGTKGLAKFSMDGELVGGIYQGAKDTWSLAWDGTYLWAIQRTCEMWNDPKIYQIEILDDSL